MERDRDKQACTQTQPHRCKSVPAAFSSASSAVSNSSSISTLPCVNEMGKEKEISQRNRVECKCKRSL